LAAVQCSLNTLATFAMASSASFGGSHNRHVVFVVTLCSFPSIAYSALLMSVLLRQEFQRNVSRTGDALVHTFHALAARMPA
jgi:hypothetical protein